MSLAVLADHMASKGRGGDSMLIHMSPREVQGLQALAMAHGGSLTINPDTGLPEALSLGKLLPAILGYGISYLSGGTISPVQAGMIVGGVETARTGDLGKGIQAGLGAYGGANLGAGMTTTGAESIGNQAAAQTYASAAPGILEGASAGLSADMAANLANAGVTDTVTANAAQQAAAEKVASATPFEKLSAGAEKAMANPMQYLKDNAKPLMFAAGPAILAELGAKKNMPQTVTKPGMITPYSFDPYSGTYTAATPYRAAEGGLMGMADGGYSPGMLDFTQKSEPVVRMAEGGVPGYADGGYKPTDTEIFNYFKTPGLDDAKIAADMQKFGVSAADIARATGTQGQQADYEKRFVNTLVAPGTDANEFLAATKAVGLQDQGLAAAMQNAGLSQGAQYALTHSMNDLDLKNGLVDAQGKPLTLYQDIGYTAGALPGDKGGLEGLYGNINYVTSGLQNNINAGKISVADAQNAALAELARTGVSVADVKAATGKDFGSLFTPKKTTITCGPGYRLNAAGTACEPIPIVETPPVQCPTGFHYDPVAKACVPNTSATQNTTTTVTTPTDIATADKTALPVGVSGAGVTTINPNGTITTRPDIPGIPEGGFTGMESLRKAYTEGGGSLGYVPYTPKTIEEFDKKYTSKLTGGSKQAYDYLTGKTPYSPIPATPTGEIMKPYAESVLGVPINLSKKMYLFDPATKQYKINPDYAIPTRDSKGKVSYALTNKDVSSFMATNPSNTAFYEWATTNNLSPEQIATASGKPINEISKLYSSAQKLTDESGKLDPTKVSEQEAADEKANFDYAAYLKANPDVQAELDAGKANFGSKSDLAAAAWNHYTTYGKPQGRAYTKKAKEGGLMALAGGGMAEQFDLGGYSDGGRLLRGPGDGVSDSIPATIGNKRPARLADGEFVVPARIVSELGNGSTEAGARKLYAMMERVQSARRHSIGKGKVAKNSRADKYLPA